MGRNFDDYRDFQLRIRCAYTFATQCTYFRMKLSIVDACAQQDLPTDVTSATLDIYRWQDAKLAIQTISACKE